MKSELAINNSLLATHSDSEVLVRVEGVSKKFCRSLKRSLWYGICDIGAEFNPFRRQAAEVAGSGLLVAGNGSKQDASELAATDSVAYGSSPKASVPVFSPPLRSGEFWAVNDVSFELRRGECLGLIGHNGAGKTTLLKMLNGLIKPDTGQIEMNGRVGALIALGAGFNPILTGRENIYIYGSVLGLDRREIDRIIDEIINFAEIREFIDMPVQSYSSGMAVRLGFAVASSLRPDILLLDEVLAVGDIGFVVKCLNRLRDLASDAAVILVSHNMQSISGFCSRVVMLEKGHEVMDTTDVTAAIDRYYEAAEINVSQAGTGEVSLTAFECAARTDCPATEAESSTWRGGEMEVQIEFVVSSQITEAECQVIIADESGVGIVGLPLMDCHGSKRIFPSGSHKRILRFDCSDLNAGKYSFTVVFRDPANKRILSRTQGLSLFRVPRQLCLGPRVVKPVLCD